MINLYGPINDLGYGVHFVNTVRHMVSQGDFTISTIGRIATREQLTPAVQAAMQRVDEIELSRPAVCFYHEFMLQHFTGSKKIAFPVFETTGIVPRGINMLKQMDAIWVPSQWAQDVIIDNGIDVPTFVVPEGVDPAIFNNKVQAARAYEDSLRFTIASIGKWETRKGQTDLLLTLEKHFASQDITILAAWVNPFIKDFPKVMHKLLSERGWNVTQNVSNRVEYKYGNMRLHMVPHQPTQADLAAIIKAADLAVFPHRGEGWGLPIIEAMALGIPTIATCVGGPAEYLTPTNSRPLTKFTKALAKDNVWFHGDRGDWYIPDGEELAEAIQDGIDGKIPAPPPDFAYEWDWINAGDAAINSLKTLNLM